MKKTIMQRLIHIILITFLFSFFSCGSDSPTNGGNNTPVDSSAFTYPFTNGSSWNYTHNTTISNFRPDSIRHYFSMYPVNGTGAVSIIYDTLINSVNTKCFLETYYELGSTFKNRAYFINTDTALIEYAYRPESGISGFTPFSKEKNIYLWVSGKKFRSAEEISVLFNSGIDDNANNDTLIIYSPSVISLKYPERTGTQWIPNYPGIGYIYKKYIGFENVTVNNIPVSSAKVQKTSSFMNSVTIFDYVSKYGITKKEITIKDVIVTGLNGNVIGLVDENEISQLTSYNIANP